MDAASPQHALRRRLTWTAYALMLAQGFTGYSVSYFTPYMESEYHTPTWASSAPNGATAIGYLVAAMLVPMVVRRIGPGNAIRLWAVGMGAAALLMVLGGSFPTVVAGAFFIGLTGAGVVVHTVAALGSVANGLYMIRSTVWSMFGAVLGPLVLWAATQTTGWSTGLLLTLPLVLATAMLVPPAPTPSAEREAVRPGPSPDDSTAPPDRSAPLGRAYWTAWTYLVLVIGAEFAFVAWGAQLIVARTGLALVDATALASLLVAGELAGRMLWGTGIGARVDRLRTLRTMTVVAGAGALVLWAAPIPAIAGVGLALGGLGIALAFPVTSSLALVYAAHAPVRAGAQLNLSWGLAILGAPLLLGIAASAVSVTAAWALTVTLLGAAWAVILRAPRPATATAPQVAAIPSGSLDSAVS